MTKHTKNSVVPGFGPKNARVFILGEAPSTEELKQGKPFVGKSGKILNDWLEVIGIDRDECYITNAIKVKLEKNQKINEALLAEWVADIKIELTKSQADTILVLGNTAKEMLNMATGNDFGSDLKQKDLVGRIIYAPIAGKPRLVIFLFHPSYIRRLSDTELNQFNNILFDVRDAINT